MCPFWFKSHSMISIGHLSSCNLKETPHSSSSNWAAEGAQKKKDAKRVTTKKFILPMMSFLNGERWCCCDVVTFKYIARANLRGKWSNGHCKWITQPSLMSPNIEWIPWRRNKKQLKTSLPPQGFVCSNFLWGLSTGWPESITCWDFVNPCKTHKHGLNRTTFYGFCKSM